MLGGLHSLRSLRPPCPPLVGSARFARSASMSAPLGGLRSLRSLRPPRPPGGLCWWAPLAALAPPSMSAPLGGLRLLRSLRPPRPPGGLRWWAPLAALARCPHRRTPCTCSCAARVSRGQLGQQPDWGIEPVTGLAAACKLLLSGTDDAPVASPLNAQAWCSSSSFRTSRLSSCIR